MFTLRAALIVPMSIAIGSLCLQLGDAHADDLFPQKSLNAKQQAKVARVVAKGRQMRSDGAIQALVNDANGQVDDQVRRNSEHICNNNAANLQVPAGFRGKVDNTTVVKGDVIMVCRTR
jgi:hypothetical protein